MTDMRSEVIEEQARFCGGCGAILPEDHFGPDAGDPRGRETICLMCKWTAWRLRKQAEREVQA